MRAFQIENSDMRQNRAIHPALWVAPHAFRLLIVAWMLVAMGALLGTPTAHAAVTHNWAATSGGMWDNAGNWDTGQVPTAGDGFAIGAATSSDYTVTYQNSSNPDLGLNSEIENSGTGTVIFDHAKDTLSVSAALDLRGGARYNISGSATYDTPSGGFVRLNGGAELNASGGSMTVTDLFNSSGAYTISAGTLNITRFYNFASNGAGGEQTGGSVSASKMQVGDGGQASYDLSGSTSTLDVGTISVGLGNGGTGTFTQSSGTITANTRLNVGRASSGASTSSGTFNMTGGSMTLNNFNGLYVGREGSDGAMNQSGGSVTTDNIIVGFGDSQGTGRYEISGGSINARALTVDSDGRFTVIGGNSSNIDFSKGLDASASTAELGFVIDDNGITTMQFVNAADLGGVIDMALATGTTASAGQTFDLISATGGITDSGYGLAAGDESGWQLDVIGGDTLQAMYLVPEPSSLLLLVASILLILYRDPRRARR